MFPSFIDMVENRYRCCGWYNVFDHCIPQFKAEIISNALEKNALEQFKDALTKREDYFSK